MSISSIQKKAVMALTGLGLFIFLIAHLLGNLLLYKGPSAFNAYAHVLESKPFLLIPAEIGLLVFFAVHVYAALRVWLENKTARPQAYAVKASAGQSSFASRSMIVTGLIVLIFVPVHIWMFKYGNKDGPGRLWGLVVTCFKDPLIVVGYVFAMFALGLHLSHAVYSALQTLGVFKPGWQGGARKAGWVIGWILSIGFALLPLSAYFFIRAPDGSSRAGGVEAQPAKKRSRLESGAQGRRAPKRKSGASPGRPGG